MVIFFSKLVLINTVSEVKALLVSTYVMKVKKMINLADVKYKLSFIPRYIAVLRITLTSILYIHIYKYSTL